MLFSNDILGYSSGIGIHENPKCLNSHFVYILQKVRRLDAASVMYAGIISIGKFRKIG